VNDDAEPLNATDRAIDLVRAQAAAPLESPQRIDELEGPDSRRVHRLALGTNQQPPTISRRLRRDTPGDGERIIDDERQSATPFCCKALQLAHAQPAWESDGLCELAEILHGGPAVNLGAGPAPGVRRHDARNRLVVLGNGYFLAPFDALDQFREPRLRLIDSDPIHGAPA